MKLAHDPKGIHVGAYLEANLVGVGSFFPGAAEAQLRKLAVLPDMQGLGIGSHIKMTGADAPRDRKITKLWCDARCSAIDVYARLGFEVESDVFLKSG